MSSSESESESTYQEPSELLKRLFLPPKNPSLALSADQEWIVICEEPPLPGIEILAKQEEKLAGIRFDPILLTPSRLDYATSLTLQHLKTGKTQDIALPTNSEGIRYIKFNPSKSVFVFTSKVKNESKLELYKCELDVTETGQWLPLQHIDLGSRQMNFVYGSSYQFTSTGDYLLVKVVPEGWPTNPPEEPVSTGPAIQVVSKNARKAPGRTYQDLLRNQYDEAKLKYYMTTQLLKISIETTTLDVQPVPQCGDGYLIRSIQSSPSGKYLLVQTTTDYSYSVPLRRFGKNIELWSLDSPDKKFL